MKKDKKYLRLSIFDGIWIVLAITVAILIYASIACPQDIVTSQTQFTVVLDCSDSGSGLATMQFSTDGGSAWTGAVPYATEYPLEIVIDGEYTVICKVADRAGNEWVSDPVKIIVDRIPPEGVVTIRVEVKT